MESVCPQCGKPVRDYHQFCPNCAQDLMATEAIPPSLSEQKPSGEPRLRCPSCRKPIGEHNDFCPWCDQQLKGEKTGSTPDRPSAAQETQTIIGSPLAPLTMEANKVDLEKAQAFPAVPSIEEPTLRGVPSPQLYAPKTLLPQEAQQSWVPIQMDLKCGKKYTQNQMDVLEFNLRNVSPANIDGLKISVKGGIMDGVAQEESPCLMAPGDLFSMHISGFFPKRVGRDSLEISVNGTLEDRGVFHLLGKTVVEVAPKEQSDRKIKVNIKSVGPTIVDMENALRSPFTGNSQSPSASATQWIPIPLDWDKKKQERESRYFPPACINPALFPTEKNLIVRIREISPDDAPRAALSCADGKTYFLVFGKTLLLGRGESCHIPACLLPLEKHTINGSVSRRHCQLFIRNRRAYLRDSSSNGTFIHKQRIPEKDEVPVADNDRIWIADVLELKLRIFTNGDSMMGILVERILNKTTEAYLLAQAPVPIGSGERLPIRMEGFPEIWGAIYFDTQTASWYFRKPYSSSDRSAHLRLEPYHELEHAGRKVYFSQL